MSGNKIQIYKGMNKERLECILKGIEKVKVALIGDMCIDIYWRADMTKSELSRETPHFPLPVVEEWMSPGAGANAVSNFACLKPAEVYAIGMTGTDWRGSILLQELKNRKVDTSGVFTSNRRVTNAYCKPLKRGISNLEYEDPRIDFCNYEPLASEDEKKLIEKLEQIADKIDILCVSDQFEFGCITPAVRNKITELAKKGLTVVVDSRERIGLYSNVILKPNEIEGYRAAFKEGNPKNTGFEELVTAAEILSKDNKAKVCMTMGARGCIYTDNTGTKHIPSYEVSPPIDTCGAGDTFLSAFSCALAAGATEYEAASFGNIAADITIKKIGMTGTANPEEIKARHMEILSQQQTTL